MVILKAVPDICSNTTESVTSDGVATPLTENEALEDHSAVHEWLQSSKTNNTFEHFGSLEVTRTSDPCAGDRFLIIDKSQNLALACHSGHLRLEDMNNLDPDKPISRHLQWLCTEKDGFKGFQNISNGGFLGHDIWWDFYAKVQQHNGWENFTLTRREGGYYWIQCLNWWTLWQFSARSDGQGVFAQREGGTLWEFVKIHGVHPRK